MLQWIYSLKYLHQLLRADAFDDSVIINLIDSETIRLLTYYFQPTETAREHPITHHWTVDLDVATIIQALEVLYPLQQEHRQFDRGSRWLQVVADSRARVRIQADNMDQVRRDTINEWNSACQCWTDPILTVARGAQRFGAMLHQ